MNSRARGGILADMTPLHSAGTYRNFRAVIDALPNTLTGQVIGGRLVVMPRPAPPHLRASAAVTKQIGAPFDDGDDGPGGW